MPLEDYQVINKIGKGKYSSVYLVQRLSDEKEFALKKVLFSKLDDRAKKNALSQAKLLKMFRCQNVVSLIEAFFQDDGNTLCLVLELADEGDLGDLIKDCLKRNRKLRQEEIWVIIEQISFGLHYLHSNSVLHRDIKPTNILKFSGQLFKISDFNVSTVFENLNYTRTGTLCYASPQIWNGLPYDSKCDIWSFGCLLYQIITLQKPFYSDNIQELFKKISKTQYPKISDNYSRQLRDLVTFMIQTNPKLRPSSNTILKMCKSRKSPVKNNIQPRARGHILTPNIFSSSKDNHQQMNSISMAISASTNRSPSRGKFFSQLSRKNYPTYRKNSINEYEDRLANLQVNKDVGLKITERGNNSNSNRDEGSLDSPQPSIKKSNNRFMVSKVKHPVKKTRRHTQI